MLGYFIKEEIFFFFFNEQKAVRDITLIINNFFLPLDYNLSAEFAVVKIVNFVLSGCHRSQTTL